MSRNLLAQHRLDEFKDWLTKNKFHNRKPMGDWQVWQIRAQDGRWHCIFERIGAKEHYTVARPLEYIVKLFIRETKEKPWL